MGALAEVPLWSAEAEQAWEAGRTAAPSPGGGPPRVGCSSWGPRWGSDPRLRPGRLTSACPPGDSTLWQRSHFRQKRCQFLPRELTFSAEGNREGGCGWGPPCPSARERPATRELGIRHPGSSRGERGGGQGTTPRSVGPENCDWGHPAPPGAPAPRTPHPAAPSRPASPKYTGSWQRGQLQLMARPATRPQRPDARGPRSPRGPQAAAWHRPSAAPPTTELPAFGCPSPQKWSPGSRAGAVPKSPTPGKEPGPAAQPSWALSVAGRRTASRPRTALVAEKRPRGRRGFRNTTLGLCTKGLEGVPLGGEGRPSRLASWQPGPSQGLPPAPCSALLLCLQSSSTQCASQQQCPPHGRSGESHA